MHLWLTGGHLNLSTLAKINRITYEATDCLYFTFICEEKHKHNKMAIFHKNVPAAKKNTPQQCRNNFKKHKGDFIPKNLQVIPKDTTVCTYIPICPIM